MKLTHLRQDAYKTRPWKNGRGVTMELYLDPPEADQNSFDLRISLAPITESGPFSPFPGAERRITLIEGTGLDLDFGDHVLHLDPFEPQGFDSGLAPEGRPLSGPVRVINIMARRQRWQFADCRVVTELDETLESGDLGVFFATSGEWAADNGEHKASLATHETLLVEGPGHIRLQTSGSHRGIFATLVRVTDRVEAHYAGSGSLVDTITENLRAAGKDMDNLTAADLGTIDEFHVRGRKATLEIGESMGLTTASRVLDLGSGLGGPARTLAQTQGCHVTGIDLTADFCEAAQAMSSWLGLHDQVDFIQGDATDLPFDEGEFDAAMTIHVAMNITAKDALYAEARRVLKPGSVFVAYDILQGEGGDILYPVPWAREPSISHVVTPDHMRTLLGDAGFEILAETDTTEESQVWFDEIMARMAKSGPPTLSFQAFLGDDFRDMAANQVRNLTERRIRTVTFVCRA